MARVAAGATAGLAVTLVLFWLMHTLIQQGGRSAPEPPARPALVLLPAPNAPGPGATAPPPGGGPPPPAPELPPLPRPAPIAPAGPEAALTMPEVSAPAPALPRPMAPPLPAAPAPPAPPASPPAPAAPPASSSEAPARSETPAAAPVPGGGEAGGEPVPLVRTRPTYPYGARRRGLEGWVELRFTIGPQGRVQEVEVLDAVPAGVFEEAARSAIRRWRFAPRPGGSGAAPREAVQRFEFKLES